MTWGKENRHGVQGHAFRQSDRRYWTVSFSELFDTLERDGPITYRDKAWRSEGGRTVSYPYAVIDDYGILVPV